MTPSEEDDVAVGDVVIAGIIAHICADPAMDDPHRVDFAALADRAEELGLCALAAYWREQSEAPR